VNVVPAFRRCALVAALVGLTSLAACGTTTASQPGAANSPSPAASTPAPAASTPAPDTTTTTPSGTPKVSQQPMLRLGSWGSAVTRLQQRLTALHYFDVATADGIFEQNTYHAVIGTTGSFTTKNPMSVEISAPSLAAVKLSGSGQISLSGIKAPRLTVTLSGSGALYASGTATQLDVTLGGFARHSSTASSPATCTRSLPGQA
jgi:peptidoglycan hydrolase-like protein with peptidoglycan-binding domain